MRGLIYLRLVSMKNSVLKSVRKPGTWIWTLFLVIYGFFMLPGLGELIVNSGLNSPEYFVLMLTLIQLYFGPANYAAYANRKGLIFQQSDIHFVFPSPVSPKLPLLHACMTTMITSSVISILLIPAGMIWFQVSFFPMVLFAIFNIFASGLMEVCIVICLYGNERFSEKTNKIFGRLMYLMIGCFLIIPLFMVWKNGFSWNLLLEFLSGDWIIMIPILGWEIGVYRLIILGADTMPLIASLLFFGTLILLALVASKMKCTGLYYEDAMKFADDYKEAREKAKKGESSIVGKKAKLKRAAVRYKGKGARAVFYRQYLESKKQKWFIFGGRTIGALFAAGFISWLIYQNGDPKDLIAGIGDFRYWIVPLGLLYYVLLFSGQQNRWSKERENPYIFMIPDSAFRKLWYATLMEHIVNSVNGIIIILPICWILNIPFAFLVFYLPLFVSASAVRLYADVVCETYLTDLIPQNARTILKMFLSFGAILLVIPAIVFVQMLLGIIGGLIAGILLFALFSILLMWLGARSFSRMEINN